MGVYATSQPRKQVHQPHRQPRGQQHPKWHSTWQQYPWGGWAVPPCPYPNYPWQPRPPYQAQQSKPNSQPTSILGPRPVQQPVQSYNAMSDAGSPIYTPTDIEAAMHALSVSQPDGNYYIDTGATSHMTSESGILSPYFNSSNKHRNIVVGSGDLIPILGHGSTIVPSPHPPFRLNNVLHAPKIIKNLISVRKFTTDNMVSVEFDPFGFSINDL